MIGRHGDIAYFFCCDFSIDPTAANIFAAVASSGDVIDIAQHFDGFEVLARQRSDGKRNLFVRTRDVISHDYRTYVPLLNQSFGEIRFAVVVNWHEGKNAPERILTVHSTGDVLSGSFAPTDPIAFRSLVCEVERQRVAAEALDFRTCIEATHWSGIPKGGDPALIDQFRRPVFDMEIGSSREAWTDPRAIAALAAVCLSDLSFEPDRPAFLYFGGTHFEENATRAVISSGFAPSHVLPNHWLTTGSYSASRAGGNIQNCLRSCSAQPQYFVVHKSLRSDVRSAIHDVAYAWGKTIADHRSFRTMKS